MFALLSWLVFAYIASALPVDQAPTSLNLLHLVHVPKSGGTALTQVLKKVACKLNGNTDTDPCCRRGLCLHTPSCMGSTGSCPLVTNIGRHSSNMAMATSLPCCSTPIGLKILANFVYYAFPGKSQFEDKSAKESVIGWPFSDRVAYLLSNGVGRNGLYAYMRKKNYPPWILGAPTLDDVFSNAKTKITSTYYSDPDQRNKHIAKCSQLCRTYHNEDVGKEEFIPQGCDGLMDKSTFNRVGDLSFTIIRHPFPRALSGSLYKGHNPNYDVFDLRPGLWHHPSVKPRGYRNFNFYEYVIAPEYQNGLVKMFGLSRDCPLARACDKAADLEDSQGMEGLSRETTMCTLTAQCELYRNATLDESHIAIADRILKRFRFIGLQEAYNSSVLLLAATFDLEVEESDFEKQRESLNKGACREYKRRATGSDPAICRAVMKANSLDVRLYESMHREFCSRLEAKGLLTHPKVMSELAQRRMCGDVDFSDPDQYCAQFETEEVLEERKLDLDTCRKQLFTFEKFTAGFF